MELGRTDWSICVLRAFLRVKNSVGSNPKITNFELLRTLEVELRTLSNPGSPTKTELRTHPNPPKMPNSEPTNWVRPNTNQFPCYFISKVWSVEFLQKIPDEFAFRFFFNLVFLFTFLEPQPWASDYGSPMTIYFLTFKQKYFVVQVHKNSFSHMMKSRGFS